MKLLQISQGATMFVQSPYKQNILIEVIKVKPQSISLLKQMASHGLCNLN